MDRRLMPEPWGLRDASLVEIARLLTLIRGELVARDCPTHVAEAIRQARDDLSHYLIVRRGPSRAAL